MDGPTFVILVVDRENLGRPVKLLAKDQHKTSRPTLSPLAALTFRSRDRAQRAIELACNSGGKESFRDGETGRLYLMAVDEIVIPPRRPRPVRELPPPLPLVFGPEVQCNRCNRRRSPEVHPCPWCRCPEYRIEEPCPSKP